MLSGPARQSGLAIREETLADIEDIRTVNRTAFDSDEEPALVDRLRRDGAIVLSLVAIEGDRVVGHILFSDLPIETPDRAIRGAALAPMAVLPDYQRQGIGSDLVREGLVGCQSRGVEAIIVLGHPDFYPRFGFSATLAQRLHAPFSGPALMALELTSGCLDVASATVRYADAFGINGSEESARRSR